MRSAKLFWSGKSQAVRLPKEFRFEGNEVWIRRKGRSLVLDPKPVNHSDVDVWFDGATNDFDEAFVAAALDRPRADNRQVEPVFE